VRVQVPPEVRTNERIDAEHQSFFALRACQACLNKTEKAKKECRASGIDFHFQHDFKGTRCEAAIPAGDPKHAKALYCTSMICHGLRLASVVRIPFQKTLLLMELDSKQNLNKSQWDFGPHLVDPFHKPHFS